MDTGREMRQRAANYRKAVKYLDACGAPTYEKLLKATQIAGVEMEDDLRRMWAQGDLVLSKPGSPGGKQFVLDTLRNTLEEGSVTFDGVADQLGAPKAGGCFIATAACGTDQAEDVIRLREFRDRVLRPARLGRAFVAVYERLSPSLARAIGGSSAARGLVRTVVVRPLRALTDAWLGRGRATP